MSLYDGLGIGFEEEAAPTTVNTVDTPKETPKDTAEPTKKKEPESAAKWNVNLQMMAPHLGRKRAADVAAKASALRAKAKARTSATGSTVTKTVVKRGAAAMATEIQQAGAPTAEPFMQLAPGQMEVKDEYVPSLPNDYEKWKHIFDKENESTIQEKKRKKDDKKEESRRNMGAAIAPPASLVGEIVSSVPAANADRFGGSAGGGMFSGGGLAAAAAPPSSASAAATEAEFADPFANLPVTGYGASSEPAASHTASQAKAVVHPPAKAPAMTGEDAWNARARKSGQAPGPPPPPPSAPAPPAAHHQTGQSGPVLYRQVPAAMVQASVSTPSHTVLLKNLVGPGEVDADLERETAEECSKFGTVVKTEVKELHGVAANEAVQVYVQFARQEAATKAITAMNGRYFGGRVVMADYYTRQ
eukprot:m.174972 g.174972  ORF g.174972 m.174972 type:complete len:417 (-) comp24385_c0_seq1:286-1536(-)